jgi:predicted enzyme related to lactoylglutathione lyase
MKLSETILFTHNFEESLHFYQNQLGWHILEHEDWGWALFQLPGEGKLGILATSCWIEETTDGTLPPPRIAFKTDNIETETARLKSLGVQVSPISGEPGQIQSAHFLDNQGNRFFLWSEPQTHP